MKKLYPIIALVVLALAATSSFAAGPRTLALDDDVHLNGTEIRSGTYKLRLLEEGNRVTVEVRKGKRIVASAPARFEQRERPAAYDGVVYRENGDGEPAIAEIWFAGENKVVVIKS